MDPEIRRAMDLLAEARELERRAKELKKEANDTALPLMLAMDLRRVEEEGFGTLIWKDGVSKSISGDKLRKELMLVLPADEVAAMMDRVTTITQYTSLQFTPIKKNTVEMGKGT